MSLEILGAFDSGQKAILIRVKDVEGLARSQGGAVGGLAAKWLPQFVQTKVLQSVKDGFGVALAEDHIDPKYFEVGVVPDPGKVDGIGFGGRELAIGALVGAVLTFVAMIAKKAVLG